MDRGIDLANYKVICTTLGQLIQGAAPVALTLVNGESISYVASCKVSVYSKSLAPRMDQSDGWQKTYTQGVPYYRPC